MKELKIGVIGAGGMAKGTHLPVLHRLPAVKVMAVCDLVREKAEKVQRDFGIPRVYVSYHEMLKEEDLDAVYVLTEPDQLFRVVRECLEAKLHVFMEKPMGINLLQAETLRNLALKNDRILRAGFNRRYMPLVCKVLEKMQSLTKITHVEGRFYKNSSPAFYGGCSDAFTCDVIHVIDLVRHIAGGEVDWARTMEVKNDEGLAGAWYSMMRFDNGVTGLVRSNYYTGARVHQFEIHGEGASAYIDLGYGDADCEAVIFSQGKMQSRASLGDGERKTIRLDGKELAESTRYEDYYGYRDETMVFLRDVQEYVEHGCRDALEEDFATMRTLNRLLEGREEKH